MAALPPPLLPLSQVKHSRYHGVILSHGRISKKKKTKLSFLSLYKYEDREVACLRVYARTICNPENKGFCFQQCTFAHLVGFLLLPWFSCYLVFLFLGFLVHWSSCWLVFLFLGFLVPWFSCSLIILFLCFLFLGFLVPWFSCSLVFLFLSFLVPWFSCSLILLFLGFLVS
jgi:hypothetical protein